MKQIFNYSEPVLSRYQRYWNREWVSSMKTFNLPSGIQTAWKADCQRNQQTHAFVTGGVEVKERCGRLWSFFLVFSERQGHFQVLYKLQEVLPWWANWDKANCAEQWLLFHHWQVIWMAEHPRQHAQTSTRQGTHKLPNKMLIKRVESRGWPMD